MIAASLAVMLAVGTCGPCAALRDDPRAPGIAARRAASPQLAETIAEIRVHGNHITPDDEVVRIAGVAVGASFLPATIDDVRARLEASRLFDSIEVLKRFASIADPSRIVLVLIVNEGPVRIDIPEAEGEAPRVVRRRGLRNLMFMPILDAEDGYGLTYGVRVARAGVAGERSRLSFPATWGGMKRAGAEIDRSFTRGPFSRLEVGTAVQRQRNPVFEEDDRRTRVWVRVERAAGYLRGGGTVGWQRVSFADLRDDIRSVRIDGAFDTRVDPILPRNAVFAGASIERLMFDGRDAINRTRLDGHAYIGLIGQPVLVLRAAREDASAPLPVYLRSLLGGWSSLRGFRAGAFTGDTVVNGSIELRVPLNSPLETGRIGVSVFMDAGAAYDKGQRFRDQPLQRGAGGSAWMTIAAFRMSLSVAHGRHAGTRVNFGGGLSF